MSMEFWFAAGGALFGFISGIYLNERHRKKFDLRAVDPHGDLMSDTQIWEPGYREPADVQVARVTHVFCGDCKLQVDRKCMAAPIKNTLLGDLDQVTGKLRSIDYEVCVVVNKNYDCKKKVLK